MSVESYIRALTIFKVPEMIRENVTTCPKYKENAASQIIVIQSYCVVDDTYKGCSCIIVTFTCVTLASLKKWSELKVIE